MKKYIALVLAAVMLLSPLMDTAQAFEPVGNGAGKQVTENRRGRSNYRRDRGRDRNRGRGYKRGGSSFGAGLAGAIIGGLISGGIQAAINQSEKDRTPTMYCDQYGNCWYQ